MTDCWKKDPDERPSFERLVERVEQMLLQEAEYFDLNKLMNLKIIIGCKSQREQKWMSWTRSSNRFCSLTFYSKLSLFV